MTIGMVVVAFLAARAAGVVFVMITSALSRTISAANSLNFLCFSLRIPTFNDDVTSLHVSELSEALK
jgi:hypothetical protein